MVRLATAKRQTSRLTKVAAHIAAHLDEPLDLQRLAAVACLSPYHFHRLYRTAWRETAAGTLARLRLARAALELATGERPLAVVARRAGYGSLAAFSRAFAAAYGAPPSRARGAREIAMQIEVAERGPLRIAYLTHVGPHQQVGRAFERLYAWAGPRGLTGPHAVGVAVYLDDARKTPAAELRTQAAVSVSDDTPESILRDDEVKVRTLPGGRYAVLRLEGPLSQLNAAYAALFGWLEASGRARGEGPIVEVYLNDPHDTAPADLVTEIRLPIA